MAGGSGFGQSPEAQLVAMLLRVAVNRDDAEALYPVLASELFAISDDALLALATTDAWAAGDESGYAPPVHRSRLLRARGGRRVSPGRR